MIKITKTNGKTIVINADLIASIQSTPDTIITLSNDKKILVQEDVEEVIKKCIAYKKEIASYISVKKG
ncbi:MAG: flagellar FlbD family protein [bacterium]